MYTRLKVQTDQLLEWADLSNNATQHMMETYFGLAERLLRYEIVEQLTAELKAVIVEFRPDADTRVVNVSDIRGLGSEAKALVYEAKNCLRKR